MLSPVTQILLIKNVFFDSINLQYSPPVNSAIPLIFLWVAFSHKAIIHMAQDFDENKFIDNHLSLLSLCKHFYYIIQNLVEVVNYYLEAKALNEYINR
jgi:hypothetical protein